MKEPVVAHQVRFQHVQGSCVVQIPALRVAAGERVGLCGPSGIGKSTVLDLLAGLRVAQSGSLVVAGRELVGAPDAIRRAHRLATIGVVPQEHPLVDALDVRENVLLPLRIARWRLPIDAPGRADALLAQLGLSALAGRRASRLSVGERQRVAIARALVADPQVVLADEPTSGLDPDQAAGAVDLLSRAAAGRALVIASHDPVVLARLDRVIEVAAWRVQ